jgi:hypothetical protein
MDSPKEEPEWWETLRSMFLADLDVTVVCEDDPRLSEYPFIIAGAESIDDVRRRAPDAKIVAPAGRHMASILEAEGATSFLRAQGPGLFSALYDVIDGTHSYGFVVNWSDERARSRIESRAELRRLEWLSPPASWSGDDGTIELSPRSVAVFVS